MFILKVVITVAGLGTRLLPMSKELPKEMLPIFMRGRNGVVLKPLLQALFEQLYGFGFRDFCFIVGRGKRAIEDHFTPDWGYVSKLKMKGKFEIAEELEGFYNMIENSRIAFINQPEPKGFGHAVFMAKFFVEDSPFMVCAGDTYIISRNNDFLKRMFDASLEKDVYAVLLLQEVSNPKQYGIAVIERMNDHLYKVSKVVEKPEIPPSNLAIMPFYIFLNSEIFDVLEKLNSGVGGEIQLTDGIQGLIDRDRKVIAILLKEDDIRLDIGTPETYWEAVQLSYKYSTKCTDMR